MGRGRAKAKQTKVARDLKYRSVETDFASLERELRGESYRDAPEEEQVPDPYADLAEQYNSEGYDEYGDDEDQGRRS